MKIKLGIVPRRQSGWVLFRLRQAIPEWEFQFGERSRQCGTDCVQMVTDCNSCSLREVRTHADTLIADAWEREAGLV